MKYLIIYLCICFVWAVFCFFKQRTKYKPPLNHWRGCFETAGINFLICPIGMFYAIKTKNHMETEKIKKEIVKLEGELAIIESTKKKYEANEIVFTTYSSECRQINRLIRVLELMIEK